MSADRSPTRTATPIYWVDAFTAAAFRGNPAGVCLLAEPADPVFMQALARELGIAETAFLVREGEAWRLRWFTPAVEVPLCGHATLASAHVLVETGRARPGEAIRFATLSGELRARVAPPRIALDFPALASAAVDCPEPVARALGAKPVSSHRVGREGLDAPVYLLELGAESEVESLAPDFRALAATGVHGVMVTARASAAREADFVSRFFAPNAGIDEDPATGSAHCALAPWWAARLGRTELVAHQLSPRGAELRVRVEGERVELAGHAVTVLAGELRV